MVAIEHSLCEFNKFYWTVTEKTSKTMYRVGVGATTTEHLNCALCEDKTLFVWWRTDGGYGTQFV